MADTANTVNAAHSSLVVRDAEEADKTSIRSVLLEAYSQYEAALSDRWPAYKESILASVEEDGPKARIVAEWEGRIVGSALLFDSSEAAYGLPELGIKGPIVRLLGVARDARGRGVATAILRECARRSREWGSDTLYLHTSDVMASAVKLYERLGFERAPDKEFSNGHTWVKCYRLRLKESAFL